MRGHIHADRDDVDLFIANHRVRIGKPSVGAKNFCGTSCALLIARRDGRHPGALQRLDGGDMGDLGPAMVGVGADDTDANFFCAREYECLEEVGWPAASQCSRRAGAAFDNVQSPLSRSAINIVAAHPIKIDTNCIQY